MKPNKELPPPKPRKRPLLWQSYQYWSELVEMRKRHTLRISAAERGVSNLDAGFETTLMGDMQIDMLIKQAKEMMTNYGQAVGPIWDWATAIRGLGEGGLAAQLLAQIDDIAAFDTVSKLWRFAGYAVIDGQSERNARGEKSHFNRRLKSICYLIADQFIRQQTGGYIEIYYAEKERQRRLHPEPVTNGDDKKIYTDAHIHNRAWRKMVKIFLQHLWLTWRQSEGLPVSEPYVQAIMGHTNIIQP